MKPHLLFCFLIVQQFLFAQTTESKSSRGLEDFQSDQAVAEAKSATAKQDDNTVSNLEQQNDSATTSRTNAATTLVIPSAVTTFAGKGVAGNANDVGTAAMLNSPAGVAVDAAGNVYVADAANNVIRKISSGGVVNTFAGCGVAGSADGTQKASFYYPVSVAVDMNGNVYVADKGNHKIRKISPDGVVTTLAGSGLRGSADGVGKTASFDKPVGVATDLQGNVYVADQCNHKIRKITAAGVVSTLAGNGQLGSADGAGKTASFHFPSGVAVDKKGNVFVADYGNNRIRRINAEGMVSTVAGSDTVGSADGNRASATFYFPDAVAVDTDGNLYIADQVNHKIRKLTTSGLVYTVAGNGMAGNIDGSGTAASFRYPSGVATDALGNVFVADYNNNKIRKITLLPSDSTQKEVAYFKEKLKDPSIK